MFDEVNPKYLRVNHKPEEKKRLPRTGVLVGKIDRFISYSHGSLMDYPSIIESLYKRVSRLAEQCHVICTVFVELQ